MMYMTFWFLEDSRWYTMLGKSKGLEVKFQFCHIPVMYIWTSYLSSFVSKCGNNLSVDWQMRGLRNYSVYIGLTKKFIWVFHILVNPMYTMKYYPALKKKKEEEILPFATMWMSLKDIMLTEISQTEKNCIISLICGIWSSWIHGS